MKLSEIKGKKALETTAELIDPLAHILADGTIQDAVKAKMPKLEIVKLMLKRWPDDVITILALLDGEDPATYEVNMLTLPMKVYELINDPDIHTLFFSLEQTEE
jgi:hypothetical protein